MTKSILVESLGEVCSLLEESLINLYACGPEFEEDYALLDGCLHELQTKLTNLSRKEHVEWT